jgi:hypothetical protein
MVRTLNSRLDVRDLDGSVDAALHRWIHERLDRQLGKFAPQVERIDVRFGDENAHKGGADSNCLVHVVLSALPSVFVEVRGETPREAFDIAAGRAERATQRSLQKHGVTTKHRGSRRGRQAEPKTTPDVELDAEDRTRSEATDGLFGRREGHGHDQLLALKARPEADREGHTAKRNTKLNMEGMSYRLEDSTTGKPSRKSTRAGANHIKPGNALTLRSRRATHSPKAIATRGSKTH